MPPVREAFALGRRLQCVSSTERLSTGGAWSGRWAVRLMLFALAGWFGWLVVIASGTRGAYYPHSTILLDFHYPVADVILAIVIIAVEAVGLDLLLHRGSPRRLWHRALPGAVALLPISVWGIVTLMHSPPYDGFHRLWLASANLLLIFLAAGSGGTGLVAVLHGRIRRGVGQA